MIKSLTKMMKLDSWANVYTGLGILNKDKRLGGTPVADLLNEAELEEIHTADDLGKRITGRLPEDMLREWFTLKSSSMDQDQIAETMSLLDSFDLRSKLEEALDWARLYGGSGLILGIKDSEGKAEEPLDLDKIADVEYFTVMQRYELDPVTPVNGDVTSQNFGLPDAYRLNPRTDATAGENQESINHIPVHWTRIIRFEGDKLARSKFRQNNYWHASVFVRLVNALRNFHGAHDSLAVLIQDFAQAIYKISDLADIVSGKDGLELISTRLEAVNKGRSVLGAVLIGEGEEFERKSTPLTGIEHLMSNINSRLVAATDMPHTILLGESPSGLGATGDSEKRDWYDYVKAQQQKKLRPALERILKVIFHSKKGPTKGVEPDDWEIEFNPLWQPTQKEAVETRKTQADMDKIYLETGVLAPEEVAVNRFSQGVYSHETTIETDNRESKLPDLESAGEDLEEENDSPDDDES